MSKSLRVFLLSVLVVVLGASAVFAAAPTEKLTINSSIFSDRKLYLTTDNRVYVFPDTSGDISIDMISVDTSVFNAIVQLPAPKVDQPGQGTQGSWDINIPAGTTKIRYIKIEKKGTNSAILMTTGRPNWTINSSVDFTLDAPIRVNSNVGPKGLNLTVKNKGKMTFGSWAEVFTNKNNANTPNGYAYLPSASGDAKYTVEEGGELEIQTPTALQGASLDVSIADGGTLTFNIASVTTHNTNGASLDINGKLNVINRPLTLYGEIISTTSHTVTKTGNGALTLATNPSNTKSLSRDVTTLAVAQGAAKLTLSSGTNSSGAYLPVWVLSKDLSRLSVAASSQFEATRKSIQQTNANAEGEGFRVSVSGTATFASHAIYRGTQEIYPYEDYITFNNGMKIETKSVDLYVASTGNTILNGAQAFSKIRGVKGGKITVNGSANKDDGVLILNGTTSTDYVNYYGSIGGTNANVGLYDDGSDKNASFDHRIFWSADVDIDNLIVYGPAKLNISADTNLSGVKYVYLRGHRPGADNTKSTIANAKLTVGKLVFTQCVDSIDISGIKVDGTSNQDEMAYMKTSRSSDVYIGDLQLYANHGASRDFPGDYMTQAAKTTGIYVLKIDGTKQPSRITIDGTTVTGTGLSEDVKNHIYPIQLTESTDLKITGKGTYYPFGKQNSVFVGKDGKLEITRGAVIDGNLAFEGSTKNAPDYPNSTAAISYATYPNDNWFASGDNKWNAGSLNGYSTFTTQVGVRNRRTNDAGEYAVNVTGDLLLSRDTSATPYPGQIFVRTKTDIDAFTGIEFSTIGQRFKVLGTETGTYEKDYVTTYNDKFQFRIPSANADTHGVTVEVRTELAILELKDWEYIKGGSEFGQGAGHNFEISIPFDVWIRGEKGFISRDVSLGIYYYYIGLDDKQYPINKPNIYFRRYEDGSEAVESNVMDIDDNEWTADTLVRDDITLRAEFDYENKRIRLIGTSYTGENPVNVSLAVLIDEDTTVTVAKPLDYIDGVVPAYRTYTFVREGAVLPDSGPQWSTAATEAVGNTDFIVGSTGNAVFTVTGLRKATYNTGATAVFNGTTYVWQNGADTDTYYMLDNSGKETKVGKPSVRLYNGDYLALKTTSADVTSFDIVFNGNVATVTVPVAALGTTNGALDAIKMLSVKARKDGGNNDIMSVPVSYTLHASVAETDTTPLGTQTATTSTPAEFHYDVDPSVLSGDLHFILYDKDKYSWLGFYEYEDGFGYNTKDLTGVAPGIYEFKVLAYSGANSTDSKHVLYTFSVNVGGTTPTPGPISPDPAPVVPAIRADKTAVTVTLPNGTDTVTFTLEGGATGLTRSADTNPASLLTLTGTTAAVAAAGVAPGTYTYTFTATAASGDVAPLTLTVTVRPEPVVEFGVEEVYNGFTDSDPVANHTYYATFIAVGASGDVTWTVTDRNADGDTFTYTGEKHTAKSGDLFLVEGTVAAGDEQGFVVTATTAGADPIETEVTFDVAADEITSYTALAPTAGTHTAVASGYRVNFPAGVIAAEDTVFLPSWLKPVVNADGEVTGVEFAGSVGDLANGTRAKVFVEATDADDNDVYYSWDVAYAAAPITPGPVSPDVPVSPDKPVSPDQPVGPVSPDTTLSVTATQTAFTLLAGETATVTMSANVSGVTYTSNKTWAVVSGNTVTITAPSATDTATITGRTSDGRTATVSITVTVREETPVTFSLQRRFASRSFDIRQTPVSFDIDAVVRPVNNQGTVSYTWAVAPTSGLTISVSSGVVTLTATRTGTYTVTITGTDSATSQTANTTITVVVTSSGSVGSSGGGGCDAGFGAMALALALPLFLRRRRS